MKKYIQFFSGLIVGIFTALIFGIIGCIFSSYLGFNLIGSEEIACGLSAVFYGMISLPIGISFAIWLISKTNKYTINILYLVILALVLSVLGIFLREFIDISIFFILAVLYTLLLTGVANISQK